MATTDADPKDTGESGYTTIDLTQPSAPILDDNVAPTSAAMLPPGWRSGIAADGRTYYLNDATKTTQWHKPQFSSIVQQPQPQIIHQVPVVQQPQIIYVQQPQMIQNTVIQPMQTQTIQHQPNEPIQIVSAPPTAQQQSESPPASVELTVNPSPAPEPPEPEEPAPSAPKLNEFNFAQLVPDKLSCAEHLVLFISMTAIWLLVASTIAYIAITEMWLLALIIPTTLVNAILFIFFNPMYFKSYRYKYHPKYVHDILINNDNNDTNNTVSDINPSLSIQDATTSATQSKDELIAKSTKEYTPPKSTKCGMCQRGFARLVAFTFIALAVTPTATMDADSDGIRVIIFIIWCAVISIFSFKLMSHFVVYFGRKYWRYNLVLWLLISVLVLITCVSSSGGLYIILSPAVFIAQCILTKYSGTLYKMQILHALDPDVFESGFECNAQCNVNDVKEVDESLKDELQIKSDTRVVGCCCNRVLCGFKTCIRIQITTSAIAFWLIFGLGYLAPIPWLIFPMAMYVYCNLVWNAMYYSKITVNIKKQTCCSCNPCACACSKWCYYICTSPAVFIGSVPNTIFLLISTGTVIGGDVVRTKDLSGPLQMMFFFYLAATAYASFFFYLPSTGFCFHTVPVHFLMSHMLASLACFLIPVTVFFNSLDFEIAGISFSDYDPGMTLLMSAVIVVTFMSISGASCSCYRFRKSLLETQHYLTTSTGFSKGEDTKEVSLTLMRISTFVLTFADFFTDTIWTFDRDTFQQEFGLFRGVAIFLWFVQVLVQLISAYAAIKALRARMLKKDRSIQTVMQKFRLQMATVCCGCCCYNLVWLLYTVAMIALSLIVSVTKLLAIKQVREWWLSLIIADYEVIKEQSGGSGVDEQKIIDEMMTLVQDTENPVWKLYYWIESKSPKWMIRCRINAAVYNNYLISELVVESVPLLVLNIVNASDNGWTTMSYVSAISSALFILYGLLKVAYYVGYKNWDLAKFVL